MYWRMVEGILPYARLSYHLNPVVADKLMGSVEREGGVCSDTLASWWRARKDAVMAKATDLSSAGLAGVNITSSTRRTLRLLKARFQQVSEVSKDGVDFSTKPEEFKAEVLSQARELHCARPMEADVDFLHRLESSCPPSALDDPDICAFVEEAQRQERGGAHLEGESGFNAAPSFDEFVEQADKSTSDATSLDELPAAVLRRLEGYAQEVVRGWVGDLLLGAAGSLLCAVLHLLLLKKEPRWLMRKSRPIMLEAAAVRQASSAMLVGCNKGGRCSDGF